MRRVLTAARMRAADHAAESRFGMPSPLLMENAGRWLADVARELGAPGARYVVVCGPGNNGGDGLVAARFLHSYGLRVTLVLVGDRAKLTTESRRNLRALEPYGIQPQPLGAGVETRAGDVVVDALFGTGLTRAPAGEFAEAIQHMLRWRSEGAKVVAADIPSGLHTDTGEPFEPCVQADVTVTFGFVKQGQVLEPGASLCGELRCVDIGIPPQAVEPSEGAELFLVEESDARGAIPPRRSDTHKGSYGHVLVVAGSHGKSGAAAMSALGALRGGAGLVTVATRSEVVESVLGHAPEVMGWPLENRGPLGMADLEPLLAAAEKKDVLVIGPGIPRGEETAKLLGELLSRVDVPTVLDADALNAIATDLEILHRAKGPLVLTPHPGEMSRLTGMSTKDIQKARVNVSREFARKHGVTLVLKGARSLIAHSDGTVYVNPTGNPGMATGGMGDVLSGLVGALLGQGLKLPEAAWTAVYAHGLSADLMVARRGQLGLIATDVAKGLGNVWTRWHR
ncbi:NAD(P)H-hydrate dehydratase [Vitiosangium sp. GDMCC 1.1324]|uniref:NAD(P)H-hydrate dehydratase n=1 Tax=Vitiosangium sp. (strain GDMCC 1.1324) TaxID=2138576 RepID=UPI000D3756F3|nr:NAD(P)H-hydrate dehydratase [Vitiosangium sp. GDMCC 1.1324]PTL77255.1 bifunctional ADP-dependent NAD(P)H-hydrate dehydratase/NAD(P)H-hydrate epimerase [Vitiosangium sp. GDMCC 1.1324]